MIIYWMFLFLCPLLAYIAEQKPRQLRLADGRLVSRPAKYWAFASMFLVIFFVGLRTGIADSWAYIGSFKSMAPDALDGFLTTEVEDRGFLLFSYIIKFVFRGDYRIWLFTIAFISGMAVLKGMLAHSVSLPISMYLFIATTMFTYMFNGLRQFIPVSILFASFSLLLRKKYLPFLLIAFLVSTFHFSAFLALPFYFLALGKPFSIRNFLIVVSFALLAYFAGTAFPLMDRLFAETQYQGMTSQLLVYNGSNALRLVVDILPLVLCYFRRERIAKINCKALNFIINMAIFNVGFMMVSTAVGGILVGRMAVYFGIYELLLYPALLKVLYPGNEGYFLRRAVIIGFLGWFVYQATVAWNLYYITEVFGRVILIR